MEYLTLKKEVAAVLQDVPTHTLPLFKFREMFEKRYRRSVSSSDLYKMKDVVKIVDTSRTGYGFVSGGRTIALSADWDMKDDEGIDVFCPFHPPSKSGMESSRLGWAEKEVGVSLPNVEMSISLLSERIGTMLDSHFTGIPLFSFLDCYAAEYGRIERAEDGNGVPLEHLIACVRGVEIGFSEKGMKRVQFKKNYEQAGSGSPLSPPLAQLCRELVDLLKTYPRCSIPFSKLIPAYHHHFGRQCRVADYGHLSLSALLQTLPMTIQVIGEGAGRIITLAHRAQMKRFANDVLRVLKVQPGIKKQIGLDDFPAAFAQIFPARTFFPEDYGLCFFSDLVSELIENFPMVTLVFGERGEEMLAIPKREQSPQEIQKTRIFAAEVVELLGHSIRCEMPFSKFIPSYHHHFGRQCRVSDFGFSKLAELFDAIPDTVTSENAQPGVDCSPEDKILRLRPREQVKVVGEQIRRLVQSRQEAGLSTPLNSMEDLFLLQYGFALRVDFCGATDLADLVHNLLTPWVKVEGEYLHISDTMTPTESQDCSSVSSLSGNELLTAYTASQSFALENIENDFTKLGFGSEQLEKTKKNLYTFAQEMSDLLEECGGYIAVQNIENAYAQKYGRQLNPCDLGSPSLMSLLQSIPEVGTLRGKFRTKRVFVSHKANNTRPSSSAGEGRCPTTYNTAGARAKGTSAYGATHPVSSQDQWNPLVLNPCLSAQQTAAPPLFSPILSPPSYRGRDTNIFNFEQATALSSPIYDMWLTEGGAPGSPPVSPPMVWAYHPLCYPPGSPGSANLMYPSFPFGPWSTQPQSQPLMSPPCYEYERIRQQS